MSVGDTATILSSCDRLLPLVGNMRIYVYIEAFFFSTPLLGKVSLAAAFSLLASAHSHWQRLPRRRPDVFLWQ